VKKHSKFYGKHYTEPLVKNGLQLSYQINNNSGNSNFITYDFSDSSGRYDMVVDSLSNQFKQNITTHKPVIKLSYNAKKLITVLVVDLVLPRLIYKI
jgi:hypothetical protein